MLADVDFALARGALSRGWRGCPIEPSDDVELVAARHPLLDPATVVPVDLPLAGVRVLVLSGANTGGKTVALKTLGLCALLHQCGLHVPAERARMPVFADVLADIGDEQSIAASLSTFSGHLRNLVHVLEAATPRTLVLLDEVAAGTDPIEGAALARALLDELSQRAALTITTTHYAEVKQWASATPGALNGAVGFDAETLAPTYTLTLGRPGPSHALEIASRLGLDASVIGRAREGLAPERVETERLLREAARSEQAARAPARPRPRASAPRRRRCASRRPATSGPSRSPPRPPRPPSPRSASAPASRPRATSRRTAASSRRCARSCAPPAARSARGARRRARRRAPPRPSATAAWAPPTSAPARPAARSTRRSTRRCARPARSRWATRCARGRSGCAA